MSEAVAFWVHEELPVKPRRGELADYKFYCFDGVPKMMFTATGRAAGDVRFDFFDMDFNHLDIKQDHAENAGYPIARPASFDLMTEAARKLTAGIPHVRADFYEILGRMYFGELTFFDSGGFGPFEPEEWDERLGNMINLSGVGERRLG